MKKAFEIVNDLISSELEYYKLGYEISPIPLSQDVSSLSIEWLCYYFKNHVSTENSQQILSFVDQKRTNKSGEFKIAALEACAYIFTGNELYLNSLLTKLSCGRSSDRRFIVQSVAIIAPLIDYNNDYLQDSVEYNIRNNYGFADECILLFLATNPEKDYLKGWLMYQLYQGETNSSSLLRNLLSDGFVLKQQFFRTFFADIKSYILFRILRNSDTYHGQLQLFNDKPERYERISSNKDYHPLDSTILEVSRQ